MKDLFNFDRSTVISTKDKLGVKTARKNKKALLRQTKRDENFKTIIEDCGGLPAKEHLNNELRHLNELAELDDLRYDDIELSCSNLGIDNDYVEWFINNLATVIV